MSEDGLKAADRKFKYSSARPSTCAVPPPQIRSTILALYKLVCMYVCMYVGGVMVRTLIGLATQGVSVRLPAVPLLDITTLGQVVHTLPLSPSSINWYRTGKRATMPYGWEGNRRSAVALAMRHISRRQWFIQIRAQWNYEREMSIPP